jgi:glycosyltransferase involved in cell wall biosynthesis
VRIVLDLQGAQGDSRFRGIGRYTLSLAQAIVRHRGDHEIILALSDLCPDTIEPIRGLFDGQLAQANIRVWQAPGPVRSSRPTNGWRRAAAGRIREAFIDSLEPDVVHVSDLFGGFIDDVVSGVGAADAKYLTTVSIYDLIPLLNPASYFASNPGYERHFRDAVRQAKRASGWLAISESSAREARDNLGLDAGSVVNISAACDPIFNKVAVSREVEGRLRARFDLARPYVMYSGGSDARKNLDRLIHAYADLPSGVRRSHQLVLVGKMPAQRVDALQATALGLGLRPDEVRILGYVEDDDLVLLYNLCALFVLPSLHEGFGLPALEAMSCGAAVIAGNASSLPEVIRWPDAMFDPFDVASMSATMGRALTDGAFRGELIRRGLEQARAFSWDDSARRAIAAFERFHERRTSADASGTAVPTDSAVRLVGEVRSIPGRPDDQDLVATARAIAMNHPETNEPRLLVDVSSLVEADRRTGIQRVGRSMLTWLPRQLPAASRMEPVFATSNGRRYRLARPAGPDNTMGPVIATDVVLDPRPGDMFLGLDLHHRVVSSQSEFYAELRRLGIPVYFVVYDLLPVLTPERFKLSVQRGHRRWLEVVSTADGAVCISRAVADELRVWMSANEPDRYRPFRIGWFHLGADIQHSDPTSGLPDDAAETLRKLTSRPTFLLVGTIEPRKGHVQTLDAFEGLWGDQADVNLVFVGKQGWLLEPFFARLRDHPELGRRLFWLDGVSDEYLEQIYRAVTCLIAPSEGEGFGLPLIEAAQHRTPIIARDIPIFREVAGDHALYFDGLDASTLADAVRGWLSLWRDGLHPRSDDVPWLTWEESAGQLVSILFDDWSSNAGNPTTSPEASASSLRG